MNEKIRNLLLNKDVYYIHYFINDVKSIINKVVDAKLINVGTSMRMVVCFSCKNRYDYFFLKKKLLYEPNFLYGTMHSDGYYADFIADKKDNSVLEMIRCFKSVEDLPKKDVFNFVKLL